MEAAILLVEDEPGLRITICDRLHKEGHRVETASDGLEGYDLALRFRFDLLILDIMLPGKNGLDFCRDLRQGGSTIPILMLTALDQTADKVLGLKLGADDYLTKPFEMLELLARVEALLRRSAIKSRGLDSGYSFGGIRADFRSTEVIRDGVPVELSAMEFQLLRYLIEHRGETLSRESLLQDVWGYTKAPTTRTVDVHISWLRQKLEDDPRQPRWIVTVHGLGYKFTG